MMFERQIQHYLLLAVLLAAVVAKCSFSSDALSGQWAGLSTTAWLIVAMGMPIVHQIYVWLIWRTELHHGLVTRWFGSNRGFSIYAVGFALLFGARLLSLIALATSNYGALDCLIGAESERDPQGYFHVLSRDTGFDALIRHLKSREIRAARHDSFSEIPVLMNAAERVKLLAHFFKANSTNRPKKRPALESQMQALFGKTLSSEDVQETIQELIQGNILTLSGNGTVSYAA